MKDGAREPGRYVVRIRPPLDPAAFGASRGGSEQSGVEIVRRHYAADAGFLFGVARQALATVLSAAGVGRGDEVVLADFNCSTVLDSVESIGARGRFVDVHDDWTYDCAQLEKALAAPGVRAFVVTHFFGKSAWTPALLELVRALRARGVLVVEDCAHSMMDLAQPDVGSRGDAVIFSVGNDKPAAACKCGVLLVRGETLADEVSRRYADLPERPAEEERLLAVWCLVYWALTAPEVCKPGIVSVLPRTDCLPTEVEYAELVDAFAREPTLATLRRFPSAANLIENASRPGAPLTCTPFRAGPLAHRILSAVLADGSLARANDWRTKVRQTIDKGLGVENGPGARLRYTVASPDETGARRAIELAKGAGIEADCFNWSPLLSVGRGIVRDIPAWAVRPERVVNFPSHQGVGEKESAAIVAAIRDGADFGIASTIQGQHKKGEQTR